MNILKPSYEIRRYTPDMMKAIEEAARTCYLSEPRDTPELQNEWRVSRLNKPLPGLSFEEYVRNKFIKRLIEIGHQTPFEFGDIEIEFVCNRGVSHEAVRHRLISPMQESTRYCNYSEDGKHGMNVIDPMFFGGENDYPQKIKDFGGFEIILNKFDVWFKCMEFAEWGYNSLLLMGAKPEEARGVLPNDLKTKLKIKANIREWWHIFNLRAVNPKAHPQIREVMIPALAECTKIFPALFKHIKIDDV